MSDYEVRLEPSIGAKYFKAYSKSTSILFLVQISSTNQLPAFKGWSVDLTLDFYVYTTLRHTTDTNFTKDGGKVYIVVKLGGYVKRFGDISTDTLQWFSYGLEDTAHLMKPITALPINGSELKDGDTNRYSINYQQTMSMFKNHGNDSYDFTALYKQNFNRIGWKQSTFTGGDYMGFEVTRDTHAKSHDGQPNLFGIHVFSCDKFGKASVKISCNVSYIGGANFSGKSETYELDLSQDTMAKSLL